MLNTNQILFAQIYAQIVAGLISNPEIRLSWQDIRERASSEALFAIQESKRVITS